MAYVKALDVSHYQGVIDWKKVKAAGYEIAIVKMSEGTASTDANANTNYYGALGAGFAVGMYHFADGGDAIAEADHFVKACSPLAEGDVMVLDWELSTTTRKDAVAWCAAFVQRVHDTRGVWPLLYVNGSTFNTFDWSPVTKNCGVWIAWYGRDPEATLPVNGKIYVMHQYTSTGAVSGIAGNVDLDAWFGTVAQFKRYGYHTPTPAPAAPAPEPTPVPVPVPAPPVIPAADTQPAPATPVVVATPVLVESDKDKEQDAQLSSLSVLLNKIADFLASIFSGFKK